MASHATCEHPATKAGRAACRRGAQSTPGTPNAPRPGAPKGATRTRRPTRAQRTEREVKSEILTQPHPHNPHDDHPGVCLNCGQGVHARIHDEGPAESRLHTAMRACKHPSETWVLKGATKKKAGQYYCPCGKQMADNGPRDLAARLRF